ncbi:lytic polysaccharide monooxygenase auxiliary activity family 9 protein [Aspergillus stella-maris]|uniref:lytic polysaccharide monooxygenase auxiliary activity family 9 protein n=1 Tax=Aspergillus stella-maris TaxID=1810926 RepID=UPI003CCD5022
MLHLLSFAALLSTAAAHGIVTSIDIAGKHYDGFNTDNAWDKSLESIAWRTTATDQGFVENLNSPDIICHEGATPGALSAEVAAGGTVTLKWNMWPGEHEGPIIDYMASCNGPCKDVDKATLSFFKVDEDGFDGTKWATDRLQENGLTWEITVPSDLKAGEYVLRHEIVALHSVGATDIAQPYPQCINLKVTGGGEAQPEGKLGTELYSSDESGFHTPLSGDGSPSRAYEVPGPKVFTAGTAEESAVDAGAAPAADSSTAIPEPTSPASPTSTPVTTETSVATSSPAPEEPEACPTDTETDAKAPESTEQSSTVTSTTTETLISTTTAASVPTCTCTCGGAAASVAVAEAPTARSIPEDKPLKEVKARPVHDFEAAEMMKRGTIDGNYVSVSFWGRDWNCASG